MEENLDKVEEEVMARQLEAQLNNEHGIGSSRLTLRKKDAK